jgi:hypothetical protein
MACDLSTDFSSTYFFVLVVYHFVLLVLVEGASVDDVDADVDDPVDELLFSSSEWVRSITSCCVCSGPSSSSAAKSDADAKPNMGHNQIEPKEASTQARDTKKR